MPMEKVEFEFPDPDKISEKDMKLKDDGTVEIVVEGRADQMEDLKKAEKEEKAEKEAADDVDIEVVDDTPEKDRGRTTSASPDELTDDELESYSKKVRKRLQHFSKGYNDQRRVAEQAARERDEAIRMAQQVLEENNNLKGTVGKNQEALLEQAKRAAALELEEAKRAYKAAYESFDADAVVAAQEALTASKIKADKIGNIKLPALQPVNKGVQQQQITPAAPVPDQRALDWQNENQWFGKDDEMTSFALGLHQKLVKQGVNPQSDEYYESINSRMRQIFPDQFEEGERKTRRKSNVVAPASRSTAPKKIVLTQTQVTLAKRLGVPLEEYAKQVALELRKQNG